MPLCFFERGAILSKFAILYRLYEIYIYSFGNIISCAWCYRDISSNIAHHTFSVAFGNAFFA